MKKHGRRRLKVKSPRNSTCGSAHLNDLDWWNWFTDMGGAEIYLHVAGPDDTWHRVLCKHAARAESVRLRFSDGVLYWLVDREGE